MWNRLKEKAAMHAAKLMPRQVALWCFVRVYANTGECGPDYVTRCLKWEARER